MDKQKNFLIIGLGLMGGSYAMGLTKKGYSVFAADTNSESIAWAKTNSIIKAGTSVDVSAFIALADYIVLALYPSDILAWIHLHKKQIKPGAIVCDLAGVKTCFLDEAQNLLAPNNEFIGCHPMAGREVSGVQNADDGIFKGANFIITPTDKNTQRGIDFAKRLAKELGFAAVTQLDPAQHDQMIAHVSQLTHAIAVSLVNANNDPLLPFVTGDSFRDLTRIANINETLWSELFLNNRHLLTNEIDGFSAQLALLKQTLKENDKTALEQLFVKSTKRRKEFDKKG